MENSSEELNDGDKPISPNPNRKPPAASIGDAEPAQSFPQSPSQTPISLSEEGGARGEFGVSDSGRNLDDGEFDGEGYEVGEDDEEGNYYEDGYEFAESRHDIDPLEFDTDEAYARALQAAEERAIFNRRGVNFQDYGGDPQDAWLNIDPDDMSYEELIALCEAIGTASRGLSSDVIASLTSLSFKAKSGEDGNPDQCVICQMDFEDSDSLVRLSCKHEYHSECIKTWLEINKVCPVCITEVSTQGNKQEF